MNVTSVSKKVKGAIAFIAGIFVSIGSSNLYSLAKVNFELNIPSFGEQLIFFVMLLPLGFGMAYFLKAFKR